MFKSSARTRTPRTQAESMNDRALFSEQDVLTSDGLPISAGEREPERDYRANPSNPPDRPAPCRNLRSEK